jgi:energy-coupling factor transporter ATP-binding protein EcfA2
MKLNRVWINQIKQFRQPLEIADLQPGINLFVGPNESGKSTLVRAIRAAFFERYKSAGVDDLQPWGDSSAAPEVELEFDWQGSHWKLNKRFLNKKRCDLYIGHQHITNEEAEEKLAELLGYQFASRGASKAEHWGIPGLLWVEQGSIQDIRQSVDHAGDHLKSALSSALGEVISSGGDELILQVERERAKLLTATGRETGDYKKIIDECAAQQTALQTLNDKIANYAQSVDRLGKLLRERDDNSKRDANSSKHYRDQAKAAEAALAAVQTLQAEEQRDQQALRNCQSNLEQCRQQLRDFEQRTQQLTARTEQKTKTTRALDECRQLTAQLQQRHQQAADQYQTAKASLKAAREQLRRQSAQREQDQFAAHLKDLREKHKNAAGHQAELHSLRTKLQAQAIDGKHLTQLKKLHEQLNELRIQEQTLATRLTYNLEPGKSITLDADAVTGQGERLLLQSTTLAIPGVGTLHLQPGGTDINDLARKRERVEADYNSALQTLKVKTLAEAEDRHTENQQLTRQIDLHKAGLEMRAPKGVDALNSDIHLAEQQLQKLTTDLAMLPPPQNKEVGERVNAVDEKAVEATLTTAEAALKAAEQANNDHQREVSLRERECDNAKLEWEKLQAELTAPDRQAREKEALNRLSDLKAEEIQLQNAVEQYRQKIDAANPALLQQDIARLTRSADAMEKETTQREVEISTLQIQLELLGAQGLEESRSETRQNLERLLRHRTQLQTRAAALNLLLNLLKQKRQSLTRQLQAPLQKHLNHYLKLLFPEATLTVDEHLRPQILARSNQHGEVESLSYGAREQMGLISRLAYADLLKEAGRPTLIILDDVLVHTDEERLERMKRVLFDAGERHQVLLFSCHPERWRGLGVQGRVVRDTHGFDVRS